MKWNPLRRQVILALPALPFTFPDASTAYRRIVETINDILNFRFDESRSRSAAEIAAGTTPINYAWQSGPLRYGAKGDGVRDDSWPWNTMAGVPDYQFVPSRTYRAGSKVQITASCTIVGASRATLLQSGGGFPDYLLEIGASSSGPNPQAGEIHRLALTGGAGNTAVLHLQQLAHMWRLDDLLFNQSPCPALVVDNCWDSNYTNIDILYCTNTHGDPAKNASIIIRNGCNNLYLRGVRIEGAQSGAYYIGDSSGPFAGGAGPIYLINGKVDSGYRAQYAAALTITSNGTLLCSNWMVAGVNQQWCFDLAGSLHLQDCFISGATGKAAAIYDHRAWYNINAGSFRGPAIHSHGVYIPRLDLGNAEFQGASPNIDQTTAAAVQSKIHPQRLQFQLAVISAGGVSGNTHSCFVRPAPAHDGAYTGGYLVLNASGTQQTSRRKILQSFHSTGELVLAGNFAPVVSTDYSVEFSGGHYTPIGAENVRLDAGMDLFAVLQTGAMISRPFYTPTTGSGTTGGMTTFGITASNFPDNTDLTGYYLIDEATGEPYLLTHGVDGAGHASTLYDRTADLDTSHRFSIVAGHRSGVRQVGDFFEWTFAGVRRRVAVSIADANGFDLENMPLWGFQAMTGRPFGVPYSSSITIDLSGGRVFEIPVSDTSAFTINNPINGIPGLRYTLMIGNTSGGTMGPITFGRDFKLATWPGNPGAGHTIAFDFEFDGTYFRQITPYVIVPQ